MLLTLAFLSILSIYTRKWRDRSTFILVQCGANDPPVAQINLAMWCLLEGKRVLHPVLVIAFWVVFTGVSATRFLTVSGGGGGLSPVVMSAEA